MVFFLLVLCVNLSACPEPEDRQEQPFVYTEITVANESSSDLLVSFKSDPSKFDRGIGVHKKSEAEPFSVRSMRAEKQDHYNPNEGRVNIIICSGITGRIIKEINTEDKDMEYFEFMGYEELPFTYYETFIALYRFTITDELLSN
ncbi:MAG: hypothetical protein FWE09_05340 [Treponema sp.]|nr:hypothetical protein [Treponema sp.]